MNWKKNLAILLVCGFIGCGTPASVRIPFIDYVKAADLEIKSLSARDLGDGTVEFSLDYDSGRDRGYSFFEPPDNMIFVDMEGMLKDKKRIVFTIDKKKMAGLRFITMKFFWEDEDNAEDKGNYIFLDLHDKGVMDLLGTAAQSDGGPVSDDGSPYRTLLNPAGQLGIVRHPEPADYSFIHGGKLDALPAYDPESETMWQIDLRSTDVSGLDLAGRFDDLIQADFDSKTRWPANLPDGFKPEAFMELGKNPGLGIRSLHKKGITGKGIGIAIIDQGLLVDHIEYRDRLKLYEEIHCVDVQSAMHGPAVASIAVGKNVGVAPEADLYYIAETHGVFSGGDFAWDLTWLAKSIDRIVEINRNLPRADRIRVISISLGIGTQLANGGLALEAIERAANEGILTVYVNEPLAGLGRAPLADPDEFESCQPGSFLREPFFNGQISGQTDVWVPMDCRCTASPTGTEDYVYYHMGGMSWTCPWVAGLYALACQVNPAITPEAFWEAAKRTGRTLKINHEGTTHELEKVIDPVSLIEALRQ